MHLYIGVTEVPQDSEIIVEDIFMKCTQQNEYEESGE